MDLNEFECPTDFSTSSESEPEPIKKKLHEISKVGRLTQRFSTKRRLING